MVKPDSDSTLSGSTNDDALRPPSKALASAGGQGRQVGLALVAGLLAGLAAWLVGETILDAYRTVLSPKVQREADANVALQVVRARLMCASGTFTALGAIVGLSLGLSGGLARGSARAGVKAAIVGCVAGAIAGASVSLLVLPNFFKMYDPQSQDLVLPLLTLGAICSSIGAASGLAFGIGLGGRDRWMKCLVGGLVGAALATVAYELVGAVAFPTARTELPVSHTYATRAMLHVLVAAFAGIGSALALGLSSTKRNARPLPS
jgi:hypothetical protein